LIVTTVIAGTVTSGKAVHINVGWALTIAGVAVSALLNTALFVYVFRWLTVRELSIRDVLPGAAFAAVVLALLQSFATAFITHKLQHTKATYGDFGTVIVLLSWFYLQSQVLLLAAQLNVVKQDRLWPRSLTED
jgi:YihY family inner membrane protein